MSTVAYEVQIHTSAQSELDKLPEETEDELLRLIEKAGEHRNPADHPRCQPLSGYRGLLRVRVEGYRAICCLDKPNLRVLLVDKRRRVYDRLDVAQQRAGGSA